VALAGIYLALLFLIAWVMGRWRSASALVRHPLSYTLALGVYASSWSYYGNVGFAKRHGLLFIGTHIGKTLALLLAPVVWVKVLRLTREHRLSSVADLFAFRYRSRLVGSLITLVSLVSSLPYLAQQARAVVDSLGALTGAHASSLLGLGFFLSLALFAILFGTRDVSLDVQSDGLTAALAFESLVKLSAMLAVGAAAVAGFGGLGGLDRWLTAHPEATRTLSASVREGGSWTNHVLLAFTTAFLMPRQFHVAFAEGAAPRSLRVAAWAFPLYVFLLSLPILPILWAGVAAHPAGNPDLYLIAVAGESGSPALAAFAFLGGVSASSAMVLVTFLALSAMCMNLVVKSAPPQAPPRNYYGARLWARRALIVALALASWGTFQLLQGDRALIEWGIGSFVAIAQFFPGLIGVLFLRRASARGLVAGLVAGIAVWVPTCFLPLFRNAPLFTPIPTMDPLTFATFTSLSVNVLLFGAVSLLFPASSDEEEAAAICIDGAAAPTAPARSSAKLRKRLALFVGERVARKETARALSELKLQADEASSLALRRLGERVEQNLSRMMSPLRARVIVRGAIDAVRDEPAFDELLRTLEERFARDGARLRGNPAELTKAWHFFRALLDGLPVGVCVLNAEGKIILYNEAMQGLTGVSAQKATGEKLSSLPSPWCEELAAIASADGKDAALTLTVEGAQRTARVQRTTVRLPAPDRPGVLLLIEDTTERRSMEARIAHHQERLASIGLLAAGVAHEVINPLAGIASLAQNLKVETADADHAERLGFIVELTERIDRIERALTGFARREPELSAYEPVSLAEVVADSVTLVRLSRRGRRAILDVEVPADLLVPGDRQQLQQVLINVLTNACDASPEGGRVRIAAARVGARVRITITDAGPGISDEVRARIFEPFFTTKDPGEGTGLGMSIACSIVVEHGGTIHVDRLPEGGTMVSVELPAEQEVQS
jgi:PAS domain S-box-containing protein